MRYLTTVLLAFFFCSAVTSAKALDPQSIRVLSVKRDIFYFKAGQFFIGADIRVYSKKGDLLLTEQIAHHKVIIDLHDQPPGFYEIWIVKDNRTERYGYHRETIGRDEFTLDTAGNPPAIMVWQEG